MVTKREKILLTPKGKYFLGRIFLKSEKFNLIFRQLFLIEMLFLGGRKNQNI